MIQPTCPSCGEEIQPQVSICGHCGRNLRNRGLHSPKISNGQLNTETTPYEIVPDGIRFGIALRGEVKVHGLDLEKAQELASILNSITDLHETG